MSRPPDTASSTERRLDAVTEARCARVPVDLAASMWDPDRCPAEWLPRLAKIFQVPVFSVEWEVVDQRRAISESLVYRRLGGTLDGLRLILDAVGAVYDYREPADPYTAEIDILNANSTTLPASQLADILQRQKRAAVKLTVNLLAGGELDIPVRSGLDAATVAPLLEGAL